jgi:hypothetical protein
VSVEAVPEREPERVSLHWALTSDGVWWLVEFHDGEPHWGYLPGHESRVRVFRDSFSRWRSATIPIESESDPRDGLLEQAEDVIADLDLSVQSGYARDFLAKIEAYRTAHRTARRQEGTP